jgi:O-antigen/teichoic acid export membrane protein
MYLWCAERARVGCISLAIGLATNVALNLALIPQYGLAGAVTATTISKFVVLAIVFASNRWLGMQLTRGVWLVVLLPIGVLFGPSIAVVLLIGTGLAVVRTNWLLSEEEKLRVQQVWCNLRLRGSEAKSA